jgi:hypothetical protein
MVFSKENALQPLHAEIKKEIKALGSKAVITRILQACHLLLVSASPRSTYSRVLLPAICKGDREE